jgi:hypothetical protein
MVFVFCVRGEIFFALFLDGFIARKIIDARKRTT